MCQLSFEFIRRFWNFLDFFGERDPQRRKKKEGGEEERRRRRRKKKMRKKTKKKMKKKKNMKIKSHNFSRNTK